MQRNRLAQDARSTRDRVQLPLLTLSILLLLLLHSPSASSLEESGVLAPLGKLNVPAKLMAGHCITMVSPKYPAGSDPKVTSVVVRVVIWRSGDVSPMRVVSGQPSLQSEAMDAVRLWHFKPYVRDGEPLDVTTDVKVDFDPQKPGGMVSHPK